MSNNLNAQEKDSSKYDHLLKIINGGLFISSYTLATYQTTQHFFQEYPYTNFKTKNDSKTWEGMDKLFHAYTSYQLCSIFFESNKLSSYTRNQSLNMALLESLLFGFTKEWADGHIDIAGWSWNDIAMNLSGNLFFYGQEKIFKEQKISYKFSYFNSNLQHYNPNVLGNSPLNYWRKDYNGQTFWLSSSLGSWNLTKNKWLKPISLTIGYGAHNMLNELDNSILGNNDIKRYKQYYLGIDIDWKQIQTNRKSLKVLFYILNTIKVPLPSIEFSQGIKKIALN